jgi:hypothetical protein
VLIIGQPTRGVDVGAIEFIHKRIIEMRDQGKAVLLVSVELDEIRALVRPHSGDVRRPRRRRAYAGCHRRRARPADGRCGRPEGGRGMSVPYAKLPAWAEYGLIPLVNLAVAFLISGLVVLIVGESPLEAAYHMINGAFGRGEYIGFTLYYTTTFIFTGLAVAVAFHCGLFNIGGEGQAYIGGIGVALACLSFDQTCCPGISSSRSPSSAPPSSARSGR